MTDLKTWISNGESHDLLAYHYRTGRPAGKLFSLCLHAETDVYPEVVGTIVVTNGMIQAGYRRRLAEVSGLSLSEIRSSTARIARIVIHPELRGLGLSKILVKAAEDRLRGDFPKYRYFEIAGQMLLVKRFVDWSYLGMTTSLADRRAKYVSALKYQISDSRYDAFKRRVTDIHGEDAQRFIADEYDQSNIDHVYPLRDVASLPMPVYGMGMDDEADGDMRKIAEYPTRSSGIRVLSTEMFRIDRVVSSISTGESALVKQAHTVFGTSEGQDRVILQSGDISLRSHSVVAITGPTGSGKSTLLRSIPGRDMVYPKGNKSVVDYFHDIDEAHRFLGAVGLGEAQVYTTPYKSLSTGQKYRVDLAYALSRLNGVVRVDEFGSSLDRLSALSVYRGLLRLVEDTGHTIILAVNDTGKIGGSCRIIKMGYWGSWSEIS